MTHTTTTDTPTVGAVIRAWRIFRGLSSKALAEKAGVRPGYLSEIENDKKRNPWLAQLEKLAAALEISLQDIQDRRLPPGQELQALFPPLPGMAQSLQPPVAAVAAGSVLQQILEQMQALTAAVSQLQVDVADLKQRMGIPTPPQPSRPKEAAQDAYAARIDAITGLWEGNARLQLPQSTPLTVVSASGERLATPREMTFLITLRLWLERVGEAELSGDGQVSVGLRPLGGEFLKSVVISHVSITRGIVEDARITLTLQSIEEAPLVFMTGTLSEDRRMLSGGYEAEGLLTEQRVWGKFSLERAEDAEIGVRDIGEGAGGAWGARERERPE